MSGIPCPSCGSCERQVLATTRREGYISRRSVCDQCNRRFTTREQIEEHAGPPNLLLLAKLRDRVESIEASAASLRVCIENQLPRHL